MANISDLLQATFSRLNPAYTLHASVVNELIYLAGEGGALYLKKQVPSLQGIKYPGIQVEGTTRSATRQLKNLKDKIEKLALVFEELNGLAALSLTQAHGYTKLDHLLHGAPSQISEALEKLKNFERLNSQSTKPGRPKKLVPYRVAMILAEEYYLATGKAPTVITSAYKKGSPAEGPYLELVQAVFQLLNIKDSPENSARDAIKAWKKKPKEINHSKKAD